jgi:hypothetical protein
MGDARTSEVGETLEILDKMFLLECKTTRHSCRTFPLDFNLTALTEVVYEVLLMQVTTSKHGDDAKL